MRTKHCVLKFSCWADCLVYLEDMIIIGLKLEGRGGRFTCAFLCVAEAVVKINPQSAIFGWQSDSSGLFFLRGWIFF